MKKALNSLIAALTLLCASSCIEPTLYLAGEEVLVEMPVVLTDMEVVWSLDVDWQASWIYGWDAYDVSHWGPIEYPKPKSYEVRRYYLGDAPGVPHTEVDPPVTVFETRFRDYYNFGYYDLLMWSNIDAEDDSQVVLINEENLDEVTATTSGTKGMNHIAASAISPGAVAGIYNQPEIFYSAYPQDVYISRFFEDYDYYDEKENVWVKKIEASLRPLVYIYLVQIILTDNDGRIVGVDGNNAMSGLASSTSVNTGHTGFASGLVYFESRMKDDIVFEGKTVDVIGGKLTTYGLCDMDAAPLVKGQSQYTGTRTDLKNMLYFDLSFVNGTVQTFAVDVTDQCQAQSHGGIITVKLDARTIDIPDIGTSPGSLFVPTVDDYEEVIWDIEM